MVVRMLASILRDSVSDCVRLQRLAKLAGVWANDNHEHDPPASSGMMLVQLACRPAVMCVHCIVYTCLINAILTDLIMLLIGSLRECIASTSSS